jgi:hypothetical protein
MLTPPPLLFRRTSGLGVYLYTMRRKNSPQANLSILRIEKEVVG